MKDVEKNIKAFTSLAGSEIDNELDSKKYSYSIENDEAGNFTIKFSTKTKATRISDLKEHVRDIIEDLEHYMKGGGVDKNIELQDIEGGKGFFIKIPYEKINFLSLYMTPAASLNKEVLAGDKTPLESKQDGTPIEDISLVNEGTALVPERLPESDSTPTVAARFMISDSIIPTTHEEAFSKNVIISNHTHALSGEEIADGQFKYMVKIPRYERGDEDIKAMVKQANEFIGGEPALTLKQRHSDSSIYYISFKDREIDQDKFTKLSAYFSRGFDSISNNVSNTNMSDLNNLIGKRTR